MVGSQGVKVHPLDVHEVDCRRCPEQNCCGKRRIAVPGDLYSRLNCSRSRRPGNEGGD